MMQNIGEGRVLEFLCWLSHRKKTNSWLPVQIFQTFSKGCLWTFYKFPNYPTVMWLLSYLIRELSSKIWQRPKYFKILYFNKKPFCLQFRGVFTYNRTPLFFPLLLTSFSLWLLSVFWQIPLNNNNF